MNTPQINFRERAGPRRADGGGDFVNVWLDHRPVDRRIYTRLSRLSTFAVPSNPVRGATLMIDAMPARWYGAEHPCLQNDANRRLFFAGLG